jgi:hypothetical protein
VRHHRVALLVIASALVLDAGLGIAYSAAMHIGVWDGLYNALANAVTLGGDVTPVGVWAHIVNAGECLSVVPLFGASFSLFTSGLTATHVDKAEGRIKRHLEERLAEHHKGLAVMPPARRPAKPNGTSERLATRDERAGPPSEPTVTDSRKLRDPKERQP